MVSAHHISPCLMTVYIMTLSYRLWGVLVLWQFDDTHFNVGHLSSPFLSINKSLFLIWWKELMILLFEQRFNFNCLPFYIAIDSLIQFIYICNTPKRVLPPKRVRFSQPCLFSLNVSEMYTISQTCPIS